MNAFASTLMQRYKCYSPNLIQGDSIKRGVLGEYYVVEVHKYFPSKSPSVLPKFLPILL